MHGHCKMTVLDPQTFAASTLADSEGLAAALGFLESCLAGSDKSLDLIVQDLCSVPNLFEFIISVLLSGRELVSRIVDAYPTDPALIATSYTCTLLQRVSSVLFALPAHLFSTPTVRQIGQNKIYVENARLVLTLVYSPDFWTCIGADATLTTTREEPEYSGWFSGIFGRKQQKKPKARNKNVPTIDVSPFHKLGAGVPSSHTEASKMACEISDNLRRILKFCLELLLEPFLAQSLERAYISTGNDAKLRPTAPQKSKAPVVVEPEPSAPYPKVQPIKVALHFENADKLGEWCIIIGTSAAKKLREFADRDQKKCDIILKKIRQLSNGRFSAENQKRLNRGSSGVPIYEAKMQQDLYLVYQIDVIPDYDRNFERQAIKIYGIYDHTRVDGFWDAVGQHLAGNGEEYSRRCILQDQPVHHKGDVYPPASFSPQNLENDAKPIHLELSNDDQRELHSLLVLDKYVVFSQAFLYSLIVNEDVQHIFELHPHERRIVECNTSCYVLGRSGTGKTTTLLFKMIGIECGWKKQALDRNTPKPRQIFVTKSRVLATKVEKYFAELLEFSALSGRSLAEVKKAQLRSAEAGLVDLDDVKRIDIPQKFSLLEESHFPLFITFDKLAQMIAADVLSSNSAEVQRAAKFFIDADEIEAKDSFVTYDIFARTYWPHFPRLLLKGFEPWLVFSEFMGVIKGSERSLSSPDGFLDETTYCGLSVRSNPTFANHRKTLYALFQAYCKLKKERRHHDVADRTHAILKALPGGSLLGGQRVDYLYVDEAQDNLLIDARLLRLICQNPDGLFWAGDTAQTISAGSSFRFDELKAFLYRIERDKSLNLTQDPVADPVMFQLAKNYRSHGGIVDCAHSVIERITNFWPDAIDTLQRERGTVAGWKPVFFHSWGQDTARFKKFLSDESGNQVELGAHQCILVRNENALEKLRQEVGDIGLIMTLYDSKGLEFNDVLLYNFFEDSPVDASRWSVLLNDAEGQAEGKELASVYAPSFGRDEGRFAGVCSELKLLYVGITRARKNLWIFDESDKGMPMRMIWTSRNEVQNCTPGTDVPRLAVESRPEEWASFGYDLFRHKKYPQAKHCFRRALMPRMVAICEAFHLREVARATIGVAPPKVQEEAFLTAADAFTQSGEDAPSGKDKLQYYRNAAECYVRAGDDLKAAYAYISAEEYCLGARCFRKLGRFDDTLEVLHKHSRRMSADCSEELYNVCRLYYCSKQDSKRPRWPLFSTFEEEEEFLEDYDLDFARAELLETHERYLEAAELHLSEKRPLDAIRDLLKEKGSRDTIRKATEKATEILLDGLWHRCSFAIAPKDVTTDQDVAELLKLARELPVKFMDPLDRHELAMFQAIAQTDLARLGELANTFTARENRKAAALLALDHFFSRLPELKSYNIHEMTSFLSKFLEYAHLLHSIISDPDPLGVEYIKQLFCIKEGSNTEYDLRPGSFLHSSATSDHDGPLYSQTSTVSLSKNDVVLALHKYLAKHLRERVTKENDLCCEAPVFSLCLTSIATGGCNFSECAQTHVKRDELDHKRYNLRLGIHLQQMYILQLMFSANPYPLVRSRTIMLDWLTYLYDAFKPSSHIQGSIADIDLSQISGTQEGIRVMKHWVREALYRLRPGRRDYLTTVLRLTTLLFTFDRPSALNCINRAHFSRHSKLPQFIYSDGHWIVEDIVKIFDGTQYHCISAGSRFLSHVLDSSQVMDLSVFCDRLEEHIGRISISSRQTFLQQFPLDGLVLPRAWLLANNDLSKKNVWDQRGTLDSVKSLLMHLQSGTASSIYTLLDANLTPILRSVFVSRICRALCFLIYNVVNHDIRQKVKAIFKALRPHPMYRKYVETNEINDYLKVALEYDIEAKVVVRDVVQLLYKNRDPLRGRPLRMSRIKDIYFLALSEIPSLLSTQFVAAVSELCLDTPAVVPRDTPAPEQKAQTAEAPLAADEPELIHDHEPTEQEISAATKIQATYRHYCIRREAQTRAFGRGLEAKKNRAFAQCAKNIDASKWGKTPYRTLYLWALPRLVVCLDRAVEIAHKLKDETKRQFSEDHKRLEERGKQMSKIRALLKTGRLLQKRIEPDAAMHRAQNRDSEAALKKAVLDVKGIIDDPLVVAPEIQEDFEFVYELVVVEKEQAQAKPGRPELNTKDLGLYY